MTRDSELLSASVDGPPFSELRMQMTASLGNNLSKATYLYRSMDTNELDVIRLATSNESHLEDSLVDRGANQAPR